MSKIMAVPRCLMLVLFATVFAAAVFGDNTFSCQRLVGEKPDLPFVVVGRVVDGDGRPVRNSSVSLDPRGSTVFPNPYESAITDEDGCFKFTGFGERKARASEWFLYTSGRFGLPGIALVYPPFVSQLQKLDPRYNGIPFVPGDREVIDLGDVPVVFRYGSARLRFDVCPKNKCSSVIQWGTVEVSLVHCGRNKMVNRGTFSREQLKQYIYDQDADLIYLLPEGNWRIEIYNRDRNASMAATGCFEIDRNKIIDVSVNLVGIDHHQ
jgi:hypothetical protein